jgi:hypothetical protein
MERACAATSVRWCGRCCSTTKHAAAICSRPTLSASCASRSPRIVRLWRITDARSVNGRVLRYSFPDDYGQLPLSAPSVFNFFKPTFAQPGEIRDAGLVSPEFQIATDTQLVTAPNALGFRLFPVLRWQPLQLRLGRQRAGAERDVVGLRSAEDAGDRSGSADRTSRIWC